MPGLLPSSLWQTCLLMIALFWIFFNRACAKDTLKISSFSECLENADIVIDNVDMEYDADIRRIKFDVTGTSSKSQNVTAILKVEAYGKDVYNKDFNPCDPATHVAGLCPVPVGTFSATSSQTIPQEYANQIPSIVFSIPDIALQATIEFNRLGDGKNIGCVITDLGNGRSIDSKGIAYGAAGTLAAALLISAATSLVGVSNGGNKPGERVASSPSFSDMLAWFQAVASSGMLSVNYAPLYRSFTQRLAFSTGLISWSHMQESIDDFRLRTGGDLTTNNTGYLKNSTTALLSRQLSVGNKSTIIDSGSSIHSNIVRSSGIEAYVEETGIVQENAFMTVFLIACIVILAITVTTLLFKVILEAWNLCGKCPKPLTGFRKHYWGTIFRSNVIVINTFYGIWVLYSIHQFRVGDSWAATLLAALTLAVFSGILIFFAVRIFGAARHNIKTEGSAARLFEDKEIWLKYSLLYNAYHQKTWWFFAPSILYNFTRYALIAALSGRGFAQSVSVLIVEILMLTLLLYLRPFVRKRENFVNILIHIVRVLLSGAILVFVDELKVQRSTQTIMGFALVIITSALTLLLVGLLMFNAIYVCCKDNPHRKRRKQAEKRQRRESQFFGDPHHHDTSYRASNAMEYTLAPQYPQYSNPTKAPLLITRGL